MRTWVCVTNRCLCRGGCDCGVGGAGRYQYVRLWFRARLARHQGVFGFLADRLPVRFSGGWAGGCCVVALEVVRKVWPRVLGHQTAPCDFVLDHACGRERSFRPGGLVP